MKHTSKTLLALGISLAVTSCGDNDSEKHSAASSSGLAVDGYIAGAKVTCDSNRNGIADKNEKVAITNKNGKFSFSPACNYPVVISGGMNQVSDTVSYPFLGNLTAPRGSTVISPLTTVQAESRLSSSQLAELLGLPKKTNINNTDPTKNLALYKSTLAIEQMTQKLAAVFGSAPGCSTGYSDIAALIGKQLAKEAAKPASQRKPLFKADGSVDDSLLVTMITDVNTFYGNVITPAELLLVTAELKTQSEKFLNPLITDLVQLQGKAVELQDPKLPPVVTTADDNYLFLKNDAFKINGQEIPYTDFVNSANTPALSSFGFDFELFGVPEIDSTVSIVLTLDEVGGSSRILEMMLSDVVINNNAGQLAISIPATSQVFVYGHTSSSDDANLVLNNIDPDIIHVDPLTNEATLDYSAISERILNNTAGTDLAPKFVELMDLNGTYKTRLVISALNFRQANGDALPVWVAGVTNAMDNNNQPVAPITGYGWDGTLVIAPAQ